MNYQWFGGELPLPGDVESPSRFVRASWCLQTVPVPGSTGKAIDSTVAIMQNLAKPVVQTGSVTLTTTIRDHTAKRYYWRSVYQPNLKYLDLSAVDLSAGKPVKVLDANADVEGNIFLTFRSSIFFVQYSKFSLVPIFAVNE